MTKTSFSHGQLRTIVERIERLNEEKATIAADIAEVYLEAKGNGFDVKILRKVIALRKKDAADRSEEESMIEIYMAGISGPIESLHTDHDAVPARQRRHAGGVEVVTDPKPNITSPAEPIPELPPSAILPVDTVATAASDSLTDQPSNVVGEEGPSLAALRIPTHSDFRAVL